MVSIQSPASQAAESDRRRKSATQMTMERVKANHLARQLQMRLQYARLKVEHGWQKQNLNEVENLYFHNSHLRGPKLFVTTPTPPTIITTQPSPERSQPVLPPGTQLLSSSNFELSKTFPPTAITSIPAIRSSGETFAVNQNPSPIPQSTISTVTAAANPSISVTANTPAVTSKSISPDTAAMVVDSQISSTSSSSQTEPLQVQSTLPLAQNSISPTQIPNTLSTSIPTPNPIIDPLSTQPSASFISSSFPTNHYPATAKAPRSRTNKHPAGPKGAHQNLTAKDMVDFSSASALTYDSFWSSHSHSGAAGTMATGTRPTPSRSPNQIAASVSVASGIAELASAFQNSGVFANGVPDLARLANVAAPFVQQLQAVAPTSNAHSNGVAVANLEQSRSVGGVTQ